jgi:2,5-diketo-D-gluconate reductase B
VRAVARALQIGYRHIDTAQAYDNEAEIGQALRSSGVTRSGVFLASKVWTDDLAPEAVKRSAERSLAKLDTDYLDLLLIHWPSEIVPVEKTLDALCELQEDGKVRHVGVSNFTPSLMERALEHSPIFCNQIEYHPLLSQERHLNLAREHDYMITAYAPLARGKVLHDETLQEIGRKHGKSAAQVALRWLLQKEVVAVIPTATSRAHLVDNFDIFDFELDDDDEWRFVKCARDVRLVDPEFAPAWRA